MELKNLDKNILYRVCEELTSRNSCALRANLIYQIFSDIPDENVTEVIKSLVERGWLREDRSRSRISLTDRGRSEIRSLIPAKLLPTCTSKKKCSSN